MIDFKEVTKGLTDQEVRERINQITNKLLNRKEQSNDTLDTD